MPGTVVEGASTRSRGFWKAVRSMGWIVGLLTVLSTWVLGETTAVLFVVVAGGATSWALVWVASHQLRRGVPMTDLTGGELRVKARIGSGQGARSIWVVPGGTALVLIGRGQAHEIVTIRYEEIACARVLRLTSVVTRGVLLVVNGRDGAALPLVMSKPDADLVVAALAARSIQVHEPGSINGMAFNLGLRGTRRRLTEGHETCGGVAADLGDARSEAASDAE